MKKTFTLLTALCLSVILFGQSKLSITNSGNGDLRVMIDGLKYITSGQEISFGNLKSGNHTVKIFRAANDRSRYGANNRGNNYQLVYSTNIMLKQQYHVDIIINRFGKAFVDEQLINGGYSNNDEDWGDNDGYEVGDSKRPMDKNNFLDLKQSIAIESFQDSKLKIAKQFVSVNYFTATQIKELAGLFSFEDDRLNFAKFAYDYTVDKRNYFVVNDVFSYSASKETLMDYIKNRK